MYDLLVAEDRPIASIIHYVLDSSLEKLDANGNQLTRTVGGSGGITTAFTFDVRDELSTVRQGTSLLGAYSYDSRGLRVVKQGSLGYVHYTYDDHSVLYETDVLSAPLLARNLLRLKLLKGRLPRCSPQRVRAPPQENAEVFN